MVAKNNLSIFIRVFSYSILAFTLVFLVNNILTIWFDWPGLKKLFAHHELFGFKKLNKPMEGLEINLSYMQLFFYVISFAIVIFFVFKSLKQSLNTDAEILTKITSYIVRSSFWAVLIVGIADFLISFLVVEKLAEPIFGEATKINLVIPAFRITFIHFPLILLSFVIGYFTRSVGFIWLAVLVVGSEFLIVLSRFIFQYEQAFQGDLVRFGYAPLICLPVLMH